MPETPVEAALRYSLSYDRPIFNQLGEFREDLLKGEDTQFNAKVLRYYGQHYWNAEIVILHEYPKTLLSAIPETEKDD